MADEETLVYVAERRSPKNRVTHPLDAPFREDVHREAVARQREGRLYQVHRQEENEQSGQSGSERGRSLSVDYISSAPPPLRGLVAIREQKALTRKTKTDKRRSLVIFSRFQHLENSHLQPDEEEALKFLQQQEGMELSSSPQKKHTKPKMTRGRSGSVDSVGIHHKTKHRTDKDASLEVNFLPERVTSGSRIKLKSEAGFTTKQDSKNAKNETRRSAVSHRRGRGRERGGISPHARRRGRVYSDSLGHRLLSVAKSRRTKHHERNGEEVYHQGKESSHASSHRGGGGHKVSTYDENEPSPSSFSIAKEGLDEESVHRLGLIMEHMVEEYVERRLDNSLPFSMLKQVADGLEERQSMDIKNQAKLQHEISALRKQVASLSVSFEAEKARREAHENTLVQEIVRQMNKKMVERDRAVQQQVQELVEMNRRLTATVVRQSSSIFRLQKMISKESLLTASLGSSSGGIAVDDELRDRPAAVANSKNSPRQGGSVMSSASESHLVHYADPIGSKKSRDDARLPYHSKVPSDDKLPKMDTLRSQGIHSHSHSLPNGQVDSSMIDATLSILDSLYPQT